MDMLRELLESMNNPLPYKKLKDTPKEIRYGFVFEDTTFFVDFVVDVYNIDQQSQSMAAVMFYEVDENGQIVMGQTNKFKFPMRLFSTVKDIVEKNINVWDYIAFTTMESGGLVGLYKLMVKKYAVGQYHANMTDTSIGTLYIIGKHKLSPEVKALLAPAAEQIIRDKEGR